MKGSIAALLFLLLLACGNVDDIKPEDTFIKYLGPESQLELKDMCLTTPSTLVDGGGVVMLGNITHNFQFLGVEETNMILIMVDSRGNQVVQRILPGRAFGQDETAAKITRVEDGYLVIGTDFGTTGDHQAIIYAKLGLDLTPVDSRDTTFQVFGEPRTIALPNWNVVEGNANYTGVDIDQSSAGDFIIAGYTDVNGDNDYYYSKVGGSSVDDDWSRVQARIGSDDQATALLKSGSRFVLIGQTEAISNDGERGINIERTVIDEEGVIQNSAIYGITSTETGGVVTGTPINNWDDIPYDVVPKPGGYTIVGSSSDGINFFPFFMNVDLTGAASTEQIYIEELSTPQTTDNLQGQAFSVAYSVTNDPIIVGRLLDFPDKSNELMIMKANQNGQLTGSVINYGLVNGNDVANKVLIAPDGSILVGATYDFGGNIAQFALIKFNNDLELKK